MKHETVCGVHAVEAILSKRPESILELQVQQGCENVRVKPLVEQAQQAGLKPQWVKRAVLDKLSEGSAHQGIAVKVKARPLLNETDLYDQLKEAEGALHPEAHLFLVLDTLDDPHNLGACLRSAECAGVTGVIVTKDKMPKISPAVRKVASGAADLLPIYQVTNLANVLKRIKEQGVWVVGTACDEEAKSIYETPLTGSICIVLGAEGRGMRRLTRTLCDYVAYIPLAGSIDSLNVSVAAGVVLFEARRQRLLAQPTQRA